MRNSQDFWDKNAGRYDCFMRKDAAAYERLHPAVQKSTVLKASFPLAYAECVKSKEL